VPLREYLSRVIGWLSAAPVGAAPGTGEDENATDGSPAGRRSEDDLPQPAKNGLQRVLNETEIAAIADELLASGDLQPSRADVAVAITRHVNELPGERDLELLRSHLTEQGFPPSWGEDDTDSHIDVEDGTDL